MLTGIPTAHIDTPVDKVIEALRGSVFECADTVFVTDATGQLQGIVRINDLFADGQLRIGDIMEPEHEAVRLESDQEEIAELAIRLNMIAVPVVDRNERLIGAVPPEAVFRILREEHMEDLQLIAGITVHDDGPSAALDASIMNRIKRRLPWLIFGLVASSIITVVMVRFENALAANVAVAFFVPALVYIAGAIGTQAVSVSVRSLARDDVQILQVLRDELIIGVGIFDWITDRDLHGSLCSRCRLWTLSWSAVLDGSLFAPNNRCRRHDAQTWSLFMNIGFARRMSRRACPAASGLLCLLRFLQRLSNLKLRFLRLIMRQILWGAALF